MSVEKSMSCLTAEREAVCLDIARIYADDVHHEVTTYAILAAGHCTTGAQLGAAPFFIEHQRAQEKKTRQTINAVAPCPTNGAP